MLVLTCHEKQDLAGEGRPGGGRAALFYDREPQHSTVQMQEWGQEMGTGYKVWDCTHYNQRSPQSHFQKGLKEQTMYDN